MNPRSVFLPLLAVLSSFVGRSAFAQTAGETSFPTTAEIRAILAERVGPEDQGIALVVGVIDGSGRRVIAYGSLAKGDKRPLDGDTVFEIGSITKVFTTLLLMDMVQKGEVTVDDPIAKLLPASASVPERDGRKITLLDLATQSSGLPRMPTNFKPANSSNPYVDYTPELLYQFLSGYQLNRDVGAKFEYSNLGMGLLDHGLSLRAGMDYEAVIQSPYPAAARNVQHRRVALTRDEGPLGGGPRREPAGSSESSLGPIRVSPPAEQKRPERGVPQVTQAGAATSDPKPPSGAEMLIWGARKCSSVFRHLIPVRWACNPRTPWTDLITLSAFSWPERPQKLVSSPS